MFGSISFNNFLVKSLMHHSAEWWSLFGRRRVLMAKSAAVFSLDNSVQSISTNVLKREGGTHSIGS